MSEEHNISETYIAYLARERFGNDAVTVGIQFHVGDHVKSCFEERARAWIADADGTVLIERRAPTFQKAKKDLKEDLLDQIIDLRTILREKENTS